MKNKLTKKEASQEIKKRNQIKKNISIAEKNLFKYNSNFEENQKKLLNLRKELVDQYPKFIEAFKFFMVAE